MEWEDNVFEDESELYERIKELPTDQPVKAKYAAKSTKRKRQAKEINKKEGYVSFQLFSCWQFCV